jgi:hypothetical protein
MLIMIAGNLFFQHKGIFTADVIFFPQPDHSVTTLFVQVNRSLVRGPHTQPDGWHG